MPSPVFAETGTISIATAPVDRLQALFDELLLDAIGLCLGTIDLVDRDDDRNVRGLDVRDRLFRLRHDAVVGRDDEYRHVGDLRAARTHRRKCFVTGRIDEGDLTIVALDGVRADLLRDAAGFACRDVRLTNLVEERGFAVVHVAEHGDDRRTRRQHLRLVFLLLDRDFFAGFLDDGVETEALSDLDRDVVRDVLIDRRHRTDLDQLGDHVSDRHDHRRRQFLHGEQIGDLDRFKSARRGRRSGLGLFLALTLFFEQQLLLAVFFGGRLLLVRSACGLPGRPPAEGDGHLGRQWHRAGPVPDAGRASSAGTGRSRTDASPAKLGRARPRAAARRLCRPGRAWLRRASAQRRDGREGHCGGLGTLRLRSSAEGASPPNDRRLTGWYRPQLRNRFGYRLGTRFRPARRCDVRLPAVRPAHAPALGRGCRPS